MPSKTALAHPKRLAKPKELLAALNSIVAVMPVM